MSPLTEKERWAKVKEILATALETPASERARFLEAACNGDAVLREEIEGLIGLSDDAGEFIEQPAIAQGMALMDSRDSASMKGRKIGDYRVVDIIGEGGVGAVYKVAREGNGLEGEFALKLLKRGMDSEAVLRRFRDERRILARLNHPNIARFFDGGIASDGRPYFVMELLEGTPIHHYCRNEKLGVDERLELFLPVCAAVEYSHRNLVIHRDLKPTNILVTADRVPKLLDYGIAKLLDRDTAEDLPTQSVDRMMTPDYASPEQIAGEAITTAADIYSLGVLLYELLADRRPFQFSGMPWAEIQRAATSSDPFRPSLAAPAERRGRIAGDLDTIVLKAMHKSPERRYASAERLADDIRRHLNGLPVRARPETIGYRLQKFVRRNRVSVAISALSFVAVSAGAYVAIYQGAVAESKDREARKRFAEVRNLASGLLGELDASLENLPGSTPARELLARKVLHYLDSLAQDDVRDPSLKRDLASAYERLADVVGGAKASNLGNPVAALESYRKAVSILDSAEGDEPETAAGLRDRARVRSKLSDVLAITGAQVEALEMERESLQLRRKWRELSPNDPLARRAVANSLQEIAGDLDRLGRFEEALANRQRVLGVLEELARSTQADPQLRMSLALAHKRLGRSLNRLGRIDEGLAQSDRAIAIERAELARNPLSTGILSPLAFSLVDRGVGLVKKGDARRALEPLTEALRIRERIAAADPMDWRAGSLLASAHLQYGRALVAAGQTAAGLTELRVALRSRQDLAERNPKNAGARGEIAEAAAALADALKQGPEARMWYERALVIYRELEAARSLTAELAGEPGRIEALLAKRPVGGSR